MSYDKINKILDDLDSLYPDAKAGLDFTTPFELLIATILSAQCTDVRVNKVTAVLFLSLIHISEPTRREWLSRMPSSA